jgi:hypothetical protein
MSTFQLIISLISQILGISGGYLLYKYSVSPHINKYSGAWAYDFDSGPDLNKEKNDNERYARLTKTGFILLMFSFILSSLIILWQIINNNYC